MSREEILRTLLNDDVFAGGEMLTVGEYYQRMLGYHDAEEDARQADSSKGKIRSILQKWEAGIPEKGYFREVTRGAIYNPRGRYDSATGEKMYEDAGYSLRRR